MTKSTSRKHVTHRKGARGRMKSRGRRVAPQISSGEMGDYDPNRGEYTS